MAELVGGAFLGVVVSLALEAVIEFAKKAWRCRNDCVILAHTVESARPHVEAFRDLEIRSCQEWLQQLKDLLDEAKDVMETYCVWNSKRWMVSRVFYMKSSKLSMKILDINKRIKSKVVEGQMLAIYDTTMILQEMDKSMNDKTGDVGLSNYYIPLMLPSNIVSYENDPFQELKSLIISKCDLDHPCTRLGLIGSGGVGKTVVATMLHNDDDIIAKYGKECVLWVTVGRDANLSQVYREMAKFLSISIVDEDLDDQFTSIVDAFLKRRVLLILDDVWDRDIGGKSLMEWLNVAKAKGSVTLITTRSGDVLRSAEAKLSVSIALLSPENSWELFCSHAFGSDIPSVEIGDIAVEVCKKCEGLPLALEVIGASMYGKDVMKWKHALGRLSNLQGKDKVEEKLKYSYEEVEKAEQRLFLYFGAFPADYEIPTRMLCSIWHAEQSNMIHEGIESVYLEGMKKLVTLAERSLIKLSKDRKVATIHEILRELAMDIIHKTNSGEYYFHPGKALKGLPLPIPKNMKRMSLIGSSLCDSLDEFNQGDLEVLLLSRLHVEDCEGGSRGMDTRSNILLKHTKLRYLDFSNTNLGNLSEGIKELRALMYFDLSWCGALENLPKDIVELEALISLDLSGCEALEKLPEGMGKMKALTYLNLRWCDSLHNLPEDIVELEALMYLDLSGCGALEKLPKGMGKMKALVSLNLSGCVCLEKLPEGIGKIKTLTSLNLRWCESLQNLPEDIVELEALTSLDLSGCVALEKLPEGIGKMIGLTSLDVSGCTFVKELKALTLTGEWCSPSDMELKERSYEFRGSGDGEALRIFEIDNPNDVDPYRLHCFGMQKNGNKLEELEALPSVNSSNEIQDKHDKVEKLEAKLIKEHDPDMVNADIREDFKKMTFEEIMKRLSVAVQGVEAQVAKFFRLYPSDNIQLFNHIQVFNQECNLLIETLSRTVRDQLRYYNGMLRVVQDAGVDNLCQILMNVTFCIVALTELKRIFDTVVDLLTVCSHEKWWSTALELSSMLSSSSIPCWSRFSLAIRSCEWSMDIVDLAFHALQQFLAGASTLSGVVFKWSDKQLRMVLHIDGKPLYHNGGGRSLLDVTRELEGNDITALIDKLEALMILEENPTKEFSNDICKWKRSSKADANLLPIENMHSIADFLRKKLRGPIPKPSPSSLLDTFELDPSTLTYKRLIGSGGNGTVAEYEWLGQNVAVKTITEVTKKQLKAEAAILASVQHPSVVRMIGYALEEEDDAKNEDEEENEDEARNEDRPKTGHLVMELMEYDLRKVIKKRCPKPAPGKSPFSLIVAIDIMLQIGEGMQYLREHKILHRDLKAQNVLLNKCSMSECGTHKKFPNVASLFGTKKRQTSCYYIAKLADFGTAKARHNETSFKTPNLGTGSWRAPEVLKVLDKYEWPADVYSFAMTCYEILTGCVPFDKVLPTELHQHIVDGHRPRLDDVHMPKLLKDLVNRCWETDPNKRPNFDEICKTLWQCKVEIILPGFELQVGP